MTFRSLMTGVIGGLLLCLAALYPAVSLFAPAVVPGWEGPVQNELLNGFLLMLSAGIGVPIFFSIGWWAAYRANVRDIGSGLRAGALAGLAAGVIFFVGILSPLNVLAAYGPILDFRPTPGAALPSFETIIEYGHLTLEFPSVLIFITFTIAICVAAIQGAALGARRRKQATPVQPTLRAFLAAGHHPRDWFGESEKAVITGLVVGVVLGFILALQDFGHGYILFREEAPAIAQILRDNLHFSVVVTNSAARALPLLTPLTPLGITFYGLIVVFLLKNPPNRFTARLIGVVTASIAIMVVGFLVVLRGIYFNAGILLYLSADPFVTMPVDVGSAMVPLDVLIRLAASQPGAIVPAVFLLTWVAGIIVAAFWIGVGSFQGLFYSFLVSLFRLYPIDRAVALQSHIRREPDQLLPTIYAHFGRYADGYDVLTHLAFRSRKRMPEVSAVAAALHTVGNSPDREEMHQAVRQVSETLDKHPKWRWAADMSAVYHTLDDVLAAKKLDHVLTIQPPPEQQTSSLPPVLIKGIQHVGRVISELRKIEKVEDLATKLIFLENAVQAVHAGQHYVKDEMSCGECETPLPEQPVLMAALDHWEDLLLAAIKRLKGRADVTCILKSKQSTFAAQVPIICEVANKGLNVAQQVRLHLLPGQEYHAVGEDGAQIEILPPGEAREISIAVSPHNGARRLRVAWEIAYDDAIDANRKLSFADVMEFVEPDKPFKRIFPIPYVTGTPLKTDDVFVGREDVFAFIKENLLGAHQNNVIILHGQRRTGKTSVLYRLGETMADTHYAILVDMQGKPARGEADFFYSIADDITYNLEEHDIFVEMPPRSEFEAAPEFTFRSRFLRNVATHLNGKNVLLLFDEFEELQRRVEDGRLQPEIFHFLRNLMQHEEKVDFIFSGTHKLEELGAEYWSALFNIAVYKPITFLSGNEVRRLITEPVIESNLEYDPLAVERVIGVTAGHPYFTQLVLHEMIVFHNETERNYLTVADVDRVLERIVERGEAHFKFIWAESTPDEQDVLKGLAELMVSAEAVNVSDLRAFLHDRGCESADEWAKALYTLESRDILTRRNAKSPLYRFKVDLIRLWVDRTRPAL
jgi:hypothetical protein